MSYVYLSARRLLAELNGVWTDLTAYWIEDLTGSSGIQGNGPLDLVADSGEIKFVLNNMDQRFDPGSSAALAGWKKGISMRLELDYDGQTYTHVGVIHTIDVPLDSDGVDKATVTAGDWLEYAANDPLINPGVLPLQRGDDVLRTTLSLMPIPPDDTDLDVGISLFPTTFDTGDRETKAYSEFSKVARSEPGYVYLRRNGTLVFENSRHRNGIRPLAQVPVLTASLGLLLKEDGDQVLLESGDGILLNQTQDFVMDNSMLALELQHGKRVVNYFTAIANPRRLDTSPQLLFQLDEPVLIGSGETITLKGGYNDPTNGDGINAQNMQTPTAHTDYQVWTSDEGTGTDLTDDLQLVELTFGSEGWTHRVRNNSSYAGYITQYDLHGYGIYIYNPLEHIAKDTPSIETHGYQPETLDQTYQTDVTQGALYANRVVQEEKNPRTLLNKVTFLANESHEHMLAFLLFGPGDLVQIKNTKRNIDGYYYIQGIADFKLMDGGLIVCTWWVKEAPSVTGGALSMIGVEFTNPGLGNPTYVDFGTLPYILNQARKSFSFWIKRKTPSSNQGAIVGFYTDSAGLQILWSASTQKLNIDDRYVTTDMSVDTTNTVLTSTGVWYHVAVTFDRSSNPFALPAVYVNGSSQALTTVASPAGLKIDEQGSRLLFGNLFLVSNGAYFNQLEAELKDCRIYDHALTQAEVSALYAAGAGGVAVLDGMVFQAFSVPTAELADYTNQTLTSATKVQDNVFGVVGTPNGAPVGRAF